MAAAGRAGALRRAGLRFSLVAVAVGALLMVLALPLERLLLPALLAVIDAADGGNHHHRLALVDSPTGRRLQLTAQRSRYVLVGGRAIEPSAAVATATTLAGSLHLTWALAVASAWAWPARHARAAALRAGLTALALGLATALDLPLLLCAEIWRFYAQAFDPAGWHPLLLWEDFLLDGGRLLVPLALGVAVGVVTA